MQQFVLTIYKAHLESGHLGDKDKIALIIFEAISTGMMKDLGPKDWMRLPLGPDCEKNVLQKLAIIKENYNILEPV